MQLASAITDPSNPLTYRVMVNRIWHHLFGRGIVETVDNFGMQGKLPSHPELLDHLAIQFQKDNFSIKKTIRNIVLSNAFKRSVVPNSKAVTMPTMVVHWVRPAGFKASDSGLNRAFHFSMDMSP